MKKSFFLVGLNGITFWPEWGLTNLSFRPRPSGVWPERQNFKGLKGTVLNVRKRKTLLKMITGLVPRGGSENVSETPIFAT